MSVLERLSAVRPIILVSPHRNMAEVMADERAGCFCDLVGTKGRCRNCPVGGHG